MFYSESRGLLGADGSFWVLLIVDGITEAKEAEKPTWGLKTSLALALSCLQPVSLCASFFLEHLWRWLCRLLGASSPLPPQAF